MEITSEVIEKIAKACHEANRSYCHALGDSSQSPWEETPEEIRMSAKLGVMYHMMNPEVTPEESHEHWVETKAATGWKYGPAKDFEKKEHPCMVPYNQLPADQRAKDHLFKTVVRNCRDLLGV